MGTTSIEWTTKTWNPIRGCDPVSPGCKNCYAERIAARFSGPGQPFEGFATWRLKPGLDAGRRLAHEDVKLWTPREREPSWTGKMALIWKKLTEPFSWREPSMVFANSMSDLFHERLTFEEIAMVHAVMAATGRHTYQVLTKRIDRALDFYDWLGGLEYRRLRGELDPNEEDHSSVAGKLAALFGLHISPLIDPEESFDDDVTPGDEALEAIYDADWPLPNMWLGVSVEDQRYADERIPKLLQCPAAKRFVSYEPALGPVTFKRYLTDIYDGGDLSETAFSEEDLRRLASAERRLDWIIVGGESDHGARPFDINWARGVVRDCRQAGVAAFVKQLGSNPFDVKSGDQYVSAPVPLRLKNKKGGDMEEFPEDLRIREFPS